MSEQETKQNLTGTEPIKEQAEYTPSVQSDFLRETIKQKPVNKKKLFRRMKMCYTVNGVLWSRKDDVQWNLQKFIIQIFGFIPETTC